MSTGTVKFFNAGKGFGFITQDEGKKDFFFHVSELRGSIINDGDRVEFDLGESKKGPCAVNVRESYTQLGR
jgi:CspA family cold shock protein